VYGGVRQGQCTSDYVLGTVRQGRLYSSRRTASVRDTRRLTSLTGGHPPCLPVHPLSWSSWSLLTRSVPRTAVYRYLSLTTSDRYSTERSTPPGGQRLYGTQQRLVLVAKDHPLLLIRPSTVLVVVDLLFDGVYLISY